MCGIRTHFLIQFYQALQPHPGQIIHICCDYKQLSMIINQGHITNPPGTGFALCSSVYETPPRLAA
jgi:hypothetical protein